MCAAPQAFRASGQAGSDGRHGHDTACSNEGAVDATHFTQQPCIFGAAETWAMHGSCSPAGVVSVEDRRASLSDLLRSREAYRWELQVMMPS